MPDADTDMPDRNIVVTLTRQATWAYTVQSLSEEERSQHRAEFTALLQSLGQASFEEIERILQERETVQAETGLTPDVVDRLRNRMTHQPPST
jgi:hypothetical protein